MRDVNDALKSLAKSTPNPHGRIDVDAVVRAGKQRVRRNRIKVFAFVTAACVVIVVALLTLPPLFRPGSNQSIADSTSSVPRGVVDDYRKATGASEAEAQRVLKTYNEANRLTDPIRAAAGADLVRLRLTYVSEVGLSVTVDNEAAVERVEKVIEISSVPVEVRAVYTPNENELNAVVEEYSSEWQSRFDGIFGYGTDAENGTIVIDFAETTTADARRAVGSINADYDLHGATAIIGTSGESLRPNR